jgi:DnaJ-class molecular chaperone
MNAPADYYTLLEIDASATQAEIKKAYRTLALRYHPDINSNEGAEEHIKKLNQAYSVLSDPSKRLFYDRNGVAPGRQAQGQARPAGPGSGGCRGRGGRGMGCGRMRMWQEVLRKR